ncbi:restriction endonuclease subunit S [Wohlfahrtiimonas chitiniclastica]|uniref:restriction endonuclease subunit S n=1 Tax=Wohlfahrtiimonas chitiniclastica TaxID=400946 RepID=UPI001BD01B99|nr:restriction endonuclease subunit S [Wohlfahrtiimonas chitiniclastica]MBS7821110.1 restriction endonuclease subunit S [Wohlfahrtiimonas chitiniclastica]
MMNYPKYESYKDSGIDWLGEIPSDWLYEKAKWLFLKQERKIQDSDEIVTCFRDGQVTLRKNRRTEGFTNALKEHGYQGIKKGDLVIHAMDAFAGAIGVSDSDGKSTPVYSVCIPRKKGINSYYYAYYLRDLALSGFINSLAKGIRERSTDFRFSDFSILTLPVPTLSEQNLIAKFLDQKTSQIDEAIRIKEKQIELLKEQKQIMIQNAVTKGLDPNVKMKDSGVDWIGEIPEHWEVQKIKHVTSKIGSGITPSGGGLNYVEEGVPLLRSQNIHFDKIDLTNVALIPMSTHNSMSNSKVRKGDVLLNITGGSIGRCNYVESDIEMNVNQHVCIIRPTKKIESAFLNALLFSEVGQGQIWYFQQGGGREGLNFQSLKNFLITLPSLKEQKEIVVWLIENNVQSAKLLEIYLNQIEKLKEYKTTLINSAVTGKIKVTPEMAGEA